MANSMYDLVLDALISGQTVAIPVESFIPLRSAFYRLKEQPGMDFLVANKVVTSTIAENGECLVTLKEKTKKSIAFRVVPK
jgi:hypothetical protein